MQRKPGDMKLCSILQLILTAWMSTCVSFGQREPGLRTPHSEHGNDGLEPTCLRRDFNYIMQKLLSFPRQEERDIYILERKTLVAILSDVSFSGVGTML